MVCASRLVFVVPNATVMVDEDMPKSHRGTAYGLTLRFTISQEPRPQSREYILC